MRPGPGRARPRPIEIGFIELSYGDFVESWSASSKAEPGDCRPADQYGEGQNAHRGPQVQRRRTIEKQNPDAFRPGPGPPETRSAPSGLAPSLRPPAPTSRAGRCRKGPGTPLAASRSRSRPAPADSSRSPPRPCGRIPKPPDRSRIDDLNPLMNAPAAQALDGLDLARNLRGHDDVGAGDPVDYDGNRSSLSMLNRGLLQIVFSLALSIMQIACGGSETGRDLSAATPRAASPLILLPDAYEVRHEFADEEEQALYRVNEAYPAQDSLRTILESLGDKGWTPLQEDIFNPGSLSSHSEGWQTFVDGTVNPNKTVHQWLGQWSDEEGKILVYVFRFSCPVDDRLHSNVMEVRIALMPAETDRGRRKAPRRSEV